MSKDFAWELFKNTGNVDAFMIMRNIENGTNKTEENLSSNIVTGASNGDSKN